MIDEWIELHCTINFNTGITQYIPTIVSACINSSTGTPRLNVEWQVLYMHLEFDALHLKVHCIFVV